VDFPKEYLQSSEDMLGPSRPVRESPSHKSGHQLTITESVLRPSADPNSGAKDRLFGTRQMNHLLVPLKPLK